MPAQLPASFDDERSNDYPPGRLTINELNPILNDVVDAARSSLVVDTI